jgi:IS30 family transposase
MSKQLTPEQRYHIECCHRRGVAQCEIAKDIGVHKSTVCRELKRNRGQRGYRHQQAQRKAEERRLNKQRPQISPETWDAIESRLRKKHSPEAISGRMKKEGLPTASPEWIYQHIYADKRKGGDLHLSLVSQKPRRKRAGSYDRRGQIENKTSIDQRPALVDELTRIGDGEIDLVIGQGHRCPILTFTERKSGVFLARLLSRKSAPEVAAAVIEMLRPYQEHLFTLTSDNGKEFAHHQDIAAALGCDYYFAHPYSSWERGRNENANGRLRRYFPKRMSFVHLTQRGNTRTREHGLSQ